MQVIDSVLLDPIQIFSALSKDLALDSATITYCKKRIAHEGIAFLTVTLPKLSKAVLRFIEIGYFDYKNLKDYDLTCFERKGRSLRYFRSFLGRIFCTKTGALRCDACPVALFQLRQLSEYAYKLSLDFAEHDLVEAKEKFATVEKDLASFDYDRDFVDQLRKDFETYYPTISRATISDILTKCRPRAGSGTFSDMPKRLDSKSDEVKNFGTELAKVYEGASWRMDKFIAPELGLVPIDGKPWFLKRYVDMRWPDRFRSISGYFKQYPCQPVRNVSTIVEVMPIDRRSYTIRQFGSKPNLPFTSAHSQTCAVEEWTWDLSRGSRIRRKSISPLGFRSVELSNKNLTSEVLFVPKDSRGPRTIVREPYWLLMVQMSYHDWITDELERVSRNRVNFRDQSINQKLAERSSIDKKNATIDLKDASDRVLLSVIRQIFRNSPGCRWFLEQRSESTKLPIAWEKTADGRQVPKEFELIKLNKVAGMGSGLTFPTMSLLITLCISRIVCSRYKLNYNDVRDRIYVYGDDVILPVEWLDDAYKALGLVGLKVNVNKSFANSHFRESCGGDFFFGNSVAPVRLKLSGCRCLEDRQGRLYVGGQLWLLQLERHCRELKREHLDGLAAYYYDLIEKSLGMELPNVSGESPVIGRWDTSASYGCDSTGAYEAVTCLVPGPRSVNVLPNPYARLQAHLRGQASVLDELLGVGSVSQESIVKPRFISYNYRRVSAWRLAG